ncbi:MAG TPA: sensor domain-containing diguanylate cyclase [bacterium]|nr:sensor domain-containing diguanylate cyclase [bacterium]
MTGKEKKDYKAEYEKLKAEFEMLAEANTALNERVLELYTLYNISRTLSMSLQVNELFELTMNLLNQSLELDQYCLMLYDEKSEKLVIQASHGLGEDITAKGESCVENGVSWKVASSGNHVLIDDISKEENFFYYPDSGITKGSFLGVPLLKRDGKAIGVLNAHKPFPFGFKEKDVRLFKGVAEQVAVAIENAITFQLTREMVHRDELTGLYNRRYFFERLEREVYRTTRYSHPLSMLMIDIDHFKHFNDTFGHLRGDKALSKLAKVLEDSLRKADILARYGGEEFLVMLPETCKDSAALVGEKLRKCVAEVNFNEDAPNLPRAGFSITVGVAAMPDDTTDALQLLDLADKALYFGKAKGRNQVCTKVPNDKPQGTS